MTHIHSTYDDDKRVIINGITRDVVISDASKPVLIQYDNNSEVVTFEVDRYVEGHDLFLSNKVEVHYNNLDVAGRRSSKGLYEATDLRVNPDNKSKVLVSWYISDNATRYEGSLNFVLSFSCLEDDVYNAYRWNSHIATFFVSAGINNAEYLENTNADVLEMWRQALFGIGDTEEARIVALSEGCQESIQAIADALTADIEAKGKDALAHIPDEYADIQHDVNVVSDNSRVSNTIVADALTSELNMRLSDSVDYDTYHDSTFSGFASSWTFENTGFLKSISYKVGARSEEAPITKIRVRVAKNAFDDSHVIFDTTQYVDINTTEMVDVVCNVGMLPVRSGDELYFIICADAIANFKFSVPEDNYSYGYWTNGDLGNIDKSYGNSGILCKLLITATFHQVCESATSTATLELPETYELVVGDTFEMFYKGIVNAVNPDMYDVQVTCNKGNAFSKRYVFTPEANDIGTHVLTVSLYSAGHVLNDSASVNLVVKAVPDNPASNVNVLCVGDSLTEAGVWPEEFRRRLISSDGTPTGNGMNNVSFIGTNSRGDTFYEGRGGWSFGTYNSVGSGIEDNPFWNTTTGAIDFANYASKINVSSIDYMYVLLGWNSANDTEEPYKKKVQTFINNVKAVFPNCQITLMGIQIPARDGLGVDYGANGVYSRYYDLMQHVFNLNKWYADIANDNENVTFINIAGQFDTENCMPASTRTVNARSAKTETYQSNGVHPAKEGYLQIADAAYRDLIHKLSK